MTFTDYITLIISLLCLARGAARGFIRSLLAPVSLIIATIIGIFYYQATQDLVVSLLIGLFGPFILQFLLRFLLKSFAQATNTDVGPGFLSSLAGAVLTLAWGWVFIVLTLILLALLPARGGVWTTVHNDVISSISYKTTAPWVKNFLPPLKAAAQDTNAASQSDAQSLSQDPRFQKVLQDPEVQKEINDHDIAKLMSNPKIMALTQQIMNDPAMIKKLMSVYRSQAEGQQPAANPQTTNP